MRFLLIPVIIVLVINAVIDFYIYCALHSYSRRRLWPRLQLASAILGFLAIIVAIVLPKRGGSDLSLCAVMWILYAYMSVYIPKLIFVLADILSRIPFLWHRRRWKWLSWSGFGLGMAIFCLMWWGALINRYDIQVNNVTVRVENLPSSFRGFTIAQISDLHVGSFGHNDKFVRKLVDEVNAQHPDMIVFTGDIVNRRTEELKPFMAALSRLKAPMGVYAVLGNHDYGDYSEWDSPNAKIANLEALKGLESRMGWTLLNNDYRWIKYRQDSMAIIGVENIGDGPFKTYGDLSKAYPDISDDNLKVLLSHNPAHWVNDIMDNNLSNIALTLSGHTHAMQMEFFGWSPAAWRYDTWGGMYADSKGQKLYVNIGAGEVGFPARIGATPEITLFTLK